MDGFLTERQAVGWNDLAPAVHPAAPTGQVEGASPPLGVVTVVGNDAEDASGRVRGADIGDGGLTSPGRGGMLRSRSGPVASCQDARFVEVVASSQFAGLVGLVDFVSRE